MDPSVNLAYFSDPEVVLSYARATVNIGLWNSERILFEKFISKKDEILELGCGAGRVALNLAKLDYQKITATDFSPPMIETAKEINLQMRTSVRFSIADATALPFSSECFDAVIFAFNGLQMIPKKERREDALKEVFRVLRPQGIFIFTGHDRSVLTRSEHWKNEKKRWQNHSRDPELDDFGDWNHQTSTGSMFIHSADPDEIRNSFKKVGFHVLFSELRSHICTESANVQFFSDDTRFWVLQKKL